MKNLLKWWLVCCIIFGLAGIMLYTNSYLLLYNKDSTFISFGIIGITLLSTLKFGYDLNWSIKRQELMNIDFYVYIKDLCLSLGLIGTVIGFILMFDSTDFNKALAGLNTSNIDQLLPLLVKATQGIGIALYTTLVGLICAELIKVQMLVGEKYNAE